MKVSELAGAKLDYWVARAEGANDTFKMFKRHYDDPDFVNYKPSSDWSQGGPIIEREQLWLTGPYRSRKEWKCGDGKKADWDYAQSEYHGATPLEAAMRCLVASKFGNEVPDETIR